MSNNKVDALLYGEGYLPICSNMDKPTCLLVQAMKSMLALPRGYGAAKTQPILNFLNIEKKQRC